MNTFAQAPAGDSAGTGKKRAYSLVLYGGGGISFFTGNAGTPAGLPVEVYKVHPIGSLRLMCNLDHRWQIGIESDLGNFYSYKIRDSTGGKVQESALPVLLLFSVPVYRNFHLFAGSGVYFITSKLSYRGEVRATSHYLGWMAAAAYEPRLSGNAGLGFELEWLNAPPNEDGALALMVRFRWRLFSWK